MADIRVERSSSLKPLRGALGRQRDRDGSWTAASAQVLPPDQRGHGRSRRRSGWGPACRPAAISARWCCRRAAGHACRFGEVFVAATGAGRRPARCWSGRRGCAGLPTLCWKQVCVRRRTPPWPPPAGARRRRTVAWYRSGSASSRRNWREDPVIRSSHAYRHSSEACTRGGADRQGRDRRVRQRPCDGERALRPRLPGRATRTLLSRVARQLERGDGRGRCAAGGGDRLRWFPPPTGAPRSGLALALRRVAGEVAAARSVRRRGAPSS